MAVVRIYQPTILKLKQTFSLTAQAVQHLAKVLRYKVGDEFIVFNGQGGEYTASIKVLNKQGGYRRGDCLS